MAMRNYGAMLDAKLMQCIAELRAQSGDAYDRVMQKQRDPKKRGLDEASLTMNLGVAVGVAESRGLIRAGQSPPKRVRDIPPKVNTVCRGCGGTGVDHTVHIRMVQAAQGPWRIGPNTARKEVHLHGVGDIRGSIGSKGMALTGLLEAFANERREGREVKCDNTGIAFPLTIADACTWCKGTGEPQSSPNKEVPNGIVA